jgi:hypothetical protein
MRNARCCPFRSVNANEKVGTQSIGLGPIRRRVGITCFTVGGETGNQIEAYLLGDTSLPELGESIAHRSRGDLHQPVEWSMHFQNQKDRAGNRHCAQHEGRHNRCVVRCEKAKCAEESAEPEGHYTRNSNGTGSVNCEIRSQRVANTSPLICKARDLNSRWNSLRGG